MLNWWRVTRFDPAKRDERGAYQGLTWTSICDVGNSFDGEVLTLDEYERVEDSYVNACVLFARDSGVEVVEVRRWTGAGEPAGELVGGELLSIEAARDVIRQLLREEEWCRLESPDDGFAIHVGSDLYMYVGSDCPCEDAVKLTEESGLYIDEDFLSPYIPEDEDDDI